MDPNLFHLDWARSIEVLATIVVLSLFIERALALVFEHKWFVTKFKDRGLKEPICFVVAALLCTRWNFDAVSIVVLSESMTLPGMLLTAAVIAGGSKASVKLFHDVLDVRSTADRAAQDETDIKRHLRSVPAAPKL
jgi:hypothetical protein